MSTEQEKFNHSKRLHNDETAIKKQSKIAKQHHLPGTLNTPTEKQPHRLHKRHAMDCGNPECFLCGNPRKTHKDKLTAQEKRLFQDVDGSRERHSNGLKNDDDIVQ